MLPPRKTFEVHQYFKRKISNLIIILNKISLYTFITTMWSSFTFSLYLQVLCILFRLHFTIICFWSIHNRDCKRDMMFVNLYMFCNASVILTLKNASFVGCEIHKHMCHSLRFWVQLTKWRHLVKWRQNNALNYYGILEHFTGS